MFSRHPTQSALSRLDGAPVWLNSEPLTAERLSGRVVLVDFWTYSCVNWLRTLPYLTAWDERYRDRGLVTVGVHAPEFGFEHDLDNVRWAVGELGVGHPVVIDNDFSIWRSFDNRYWPAVYLVDGDGRTRFEHFGEGAYEETERMLQALLGLDEVSSEVDAGGLAQAADLQTLRSPETYLGRDRGEGRSRGGTDGLAINEWSLDGAWSVGEEAAVLEAPGGTISSASRRATSTSCSRRRRPARPSASRSGSTGRRRATPRVSMSTSPARAASPSRGCTSSSASANPSRCAPSRSRSGMRACAPTCSRSDRRALLGRGGAERGVDPRRRVQERAGDLLLVAVEALGRRGDRDRGDDAEAVAHRRADRADALGVLLAVERDAVGAHARELRDQLGAGGDRVRRQAREAAGEDRLERGLGERREEGLAVRGAVGGIVLADDRVRAQAPARRRDLVDEQDAVVAQHREVDRLLHRPGELLHDRPRALQQLRPRRRGEAPGLRSEPQPPVGGGPGDEALELERPDDPVHRRARQADAPRDLGEREPGGRVVQRAEDLRRARDDLHAVLARRVVGAGEGRHTGGSLTRRRARTGARRCSARLNSRAMYHVRRAGDIALDTLSAYAGHSDRH